MIADAETGQTYHFHPDNVSRWTDTFYNDRRSPMEIGQQIQLTGVTIEVTDVTGDGHIAWAVFRFEKPLEDPRHKWLWWEQESLSYGSFELPQVGETRLY